MSELGNEVASAALTTTGKSIEMLMKLLQLLMDRHANKYDRALKKEQFKAIEAEQKDKKTAERVSNEAGYLSAKEMTALANVRGEKQVSTTTEMTDAEVKRTAEKMKRRGICWTSVSKQSREDDENILFAGKDDATRKIHVFCCCESDKACVMEVINEVLNEKIVDQLNKDAEEIRNDPEATPADMKKADDLERQADDIIHGETAAENQKGVDEVFADVCDGKRNERTFNDTVNHFVGRYTTKTEPYYACERKFPESYIIMEEINAQYKDEPYVKTNFKVFKDGLEQKSDVCKGGNFNDEHFDGRPKGYWGMVRAEMKEKGRFSDDMAIFASKADFDKYQLSYQQSNAEKVVDASHSNSEFRDYSNISDQLKEQLVAQSGAIDENGKACDINSSTVFDKASIDAASSNDEKLRQADCIVIAKQMANYREMNAAQVEIQIAKSNIAGASDPTTLEAHNAHLRENEAKYAECEKREGELVHEREDLSFADAVNTVDDGRSIDIEEVIESGDKRTRMDEFKEEIQSRKEAVAPANQTKSPEKSISSITKDER